MDLRRQWHIVRSRLPLIVIAVVAAASLGFAAATIMPRVYESRATILIGQYLSAVNPDFDALLTSQRLTVTYAGLATRRPILDEVIRELRLDTTAEDLARRVSAEPSQTSAFLTIVVRGQDPPEAARIANAVANQVIEVSPTVSGQQLDLLEAIESDLRAVRDEIEQTSAEVTRLLGLADPTAADRAALTDAQNRLASLRSTYATLLSFSSNTGANLLTLVEPAVAATSPAAPNRTLFTLLAAVLGLLLVTAVVFISEYLNDSLRRPKDVEETLGLPTLGTVGTLRGQIGVNEIHRVVTVLYPRSQAAETYRALRANLDFASVDAPLTSLLVVSAGQNEGKTVTAANLAVVFAQAGRKVLLVDADLRIPGTHVIFGAPNDHGLTNLILDPKLAHADVVQAVEQDGLWILTSGPLPPNPAEILGSQRCSAVFEAIAADYDLVIVDSPPLLPVVDGAILSRLTDATLLVVDARRSRREAVVRARDTLVRAGARIAGVVLNRVPGDLDAHAYYSPDASRSGRPEATSPTNVG